MSVSPTPTRESLSLGSPAGLDALFAPRGVVVVGASSDPTKLGGTMAASLQRGPVPVALVSARGGSDTHSSISDAAAASSTPLDLAVVCIPAPACAGAIREAGAVGVRAALICAGGFAETGEEGARLQGDLAHAASESGVRILGPNTSGFFSPASGLLASFVPGVADLAAGGVGIVAASGGLNHALAFALDRAGAGVSLGVGIGAGFDVDAPDCLDHLAEDDATTAVALHIESVTRGPALLEAVARTSRRKPVVAMVVGRNDIGEFAQSHTGALATSWRTTRALLRAAGAVVVDDVDTLVTASSVLSRVRLPATPQPGVGLVTAQAGPGLIVTDALATAGVDLPPLAPTTREQLAELLPPLTYQANPVDTGRPGPHHDRVISAVAQDPGVAVTAVYALAEPVVDLVGAAEQARGAGHAVVLGVDGPTADVVDCQHKAAETGTPVVTGPGALSQAVAAVVEDARIRARLAEATTAPAALPPPVPHQDEGWTEAAATDVLDAAGVRTPGRRVCTSDSDVVEAFRALGAPVVVKVSDAEVLHKSDAGGVVLGIDSEEAALAAADSVRSGTGARELLVEAMSGPGTDLIVSARRDPVFGPVVMVGVGGTATEVYADVALVPADAPPAWMTGLPDELAARSLLDGHRGGTTVDREELGRLLTTVGRLLVASPHVAEIEINPVRATDHGLVALDAVILATHVQQAPEKEDRR